jgi:hypothetical protein
MKTAVVILIVIALVAGGCKNRHENITERKNFISEKYFDTVEIQPENDLFYDWDTDTAKWVKFKSEYNFATFHTEVFTGKLANPDFTGNEFAIDKEYVDFITEGCNDNGVNFGGHCTIIHRSCGCMCEHIFVIDRISGKIFNDINITTTDDGDGKWGYLYKSDSKMLFANSNLFITDSLNRYTSVWGITPELYVWTGEKFKRIQ